MRKLQYKSIQNLQTLEGYIFYILQHFATKLCNFTNFSMPFAGIPLSIFVSLNKELYRVFASLNKDKELGGGTKIYVLVLPVGGGGL
jgi:hypothetical protein